MSYFIAGVSAFLSSLCYSEYAVEFPVAGGSFTFILYTFGEFWAWITATNLIFNYGEPGTSTLSASLRPGSWLLQTIVALSPCCAAARR